MPWRRSSGKQFVAKILQGIREAKINVDNDAGRKKYMVVLRRGLLLRILAMWALCLGCKQSTVIKRSTPEQEIAKLLWLLCTVQSLLARCSAH